MGEPPLARRSGGTTAAVVVVLVIVAVIAALARGPISRHRIQEKVSTDAALQYPGAELVERHWRDERHETFIDTGGYDEQAGWTFEYRLERPTDLEELLDFYESALGAKGWQVRRRDGSPGAPWSNPGGLHLARARPRGEETIRVLVTLTPQEHVRGKGVTEYSVEYRLPYQRAAPYDS